MSLINKYRTRKLILTMANSKYAHKMEDVAVDSTGRQWDYTRANEVRRRGQFTQVTQELLKDIDIQVRLHIEKYLDDNPQKGKTVT